MLTAAPKWPSRPNAHRVYAHWLAVSDDYDFHEKQPLFSLGAQRAIAASLNTLLFRTHLPAAAPGGAARQAQQARQAAGRQVVQQSGALAPAPGRQPVHSGSGPEYRLLSEHAPVLLR